MKQQAGVLIHRVPPPNSRQATGDYDFMIGLQVSGGVPKDMPGQKRALKEFVQHNARVGDALMNLEDGLDEDDPRPAIGYVPFPKMIFHAKDGEKIVNTPEELKTAKAEGWREQPYEKPRVVVLDPAVEKAALIKENQELKASQTILTDQMSQLMNRLDAIEKKK